MNGRLVILSGPSGVGKDAVLQAWTDLNPRVCRVVSYTTRAAAPTELDGVDYHFVSENAFLQLVSERAFLEYKHVHGRYYGTPKADMERLLRDGRVAVLKIDVQGALEVMPLREDALSVFLLPPSWEELERRILDRARDHPEQIALRLENARWEVAQANAYDLSVINETGRLDTVAREIDDWVTAQPDPNPAPSAAPAHPRA